MTSRHSGNFKDKLKIGFLTALDPGNRQAWSGIIHYLAKSLAKHAGEVVFLGPAQTGRERRLHHWDRCCRYYFGKGYLASHSVYLSAGYAEVFHDRLKKNPVDVIFAPVASTEIALLRTSIPIVYMSDATFAVMHGYYNDFSNLLSISKVEANFIERLAVRKSSKLIYPSHWAANSAMNDYGATADKTHIIPMGANFDEVPTDAQIADKQLTRDVRLLFVGIDWERKGGSVAFETLRALERLNISASLTVVGCVPPAEFFHPRLTVVPFLDKNNPRHRQQLFDIYLNSEIFILPTRAECSAIVFCEAAAFGLPSFGSETGGVPCVITNHRTGRLFPLDATGTDYAHAIAALWRDPLLLAEMVAASREHFKSRLNWDAWGKQAANVIHAAANVNSRSTLHLNDYTTGSLHS